MEELHHQPDTKVLLLILTANYFISIICNSSFLVPANILYSNDIKRAILYEKNYSLPPRKAVKRLQSKSSRLRTYLIPTPHRAGAPSDIHLPDGICSRHDQQAG